MGPRPEKPRTHDAALETVEVSPSIAIDVLQTLAMSAGKQRVSPVRIEHLRLPQHRIAAASGGLVQHQLRPRRWPLRDEVHHAAQGGRAVERRRDTLDDLHALQVDRWNLQSAESLGCD